MENGTYISEEVNELFGIQSELIFSFPSMSLKKWEELGKENYLKKWLEGEGYKISSISPIENTLTANKIIFNQKFELEDFINELETEIKWNDLKGKEEAIYAEVSNDVWGYKLILQESKWRLARQIPFDCVGNSLPSGIAGISGTSGPSGMISGHTFRTNGTSSINGLAGSSSLTF
jgi:hypothetical protein